MTNPESEVLTRAAISRKLQSSMPEWNDNRLVPRAFYRPVQGQALNQIIADIVALARTPWEESIHCQQVQILHFQVEAETLQYQLKQVQHLATLLGRLPH